jgi:uncharacterized protein YndB with AHSA1/START domain
MKKLTFETDITASAKHVWETMINYETYKEWVGASWPGSHYVGKWGKDEEVRFVSPNGSGTLVNISEYKPYTSIKSTHVAIILDNGTEDRTSDMAKGWIGTTENYTFSEGNGKTHLLVEMNIEPQWESMFVNDMPKALNKLKEICEK